MTELTITLLRLGFLVLLWVFVLSVVAVLRRDLAPKGATSSSSTVSAPPAPSKGHGSLRRLVVTGGPLQGTEVPLGSTMLLVGRASSAALRLEDDYTSTRHARIYPRDRHWWIEDLGSTNGTYVADQRISEPVQLSAGVEVRIGRSTLELRR